MFKASTFMLKIVLLVICSLIASPGTSYGQTSSDQTKYHTIAHEVLKLESEIVGMRPNYELVDAIIDELKQRMTVHPPYSRGKAIGILGQIATVLHERNFREGMTTLLTETCTPRMVNKKEGFLADCDTFSFFYLAIGEALGLPLRLDGIQS